ncbi:putative PB1 domain-containing protein [Helianthus annuus]|nr:putative PB1 domain-containing protein [Helianthus annuus]
MMSDKIILEQPTVPSSGESRYMTHLWVSGYVEPPERLHHSDPSQLLAVGSLYHQEITYKIRAALKILTFREQHVLVQFWSPHDVGKHQMLTTKDQPFGLGVASEKLCSYRKDSERKAFLVDKDHEEDDVSPPARVFRRGLPEWTSDITKYETKDFPQQDCAIRCKLHGYLAFPVFDSTTGLCVGVLELLTFSKLKDVAYEVKHIHRVLKSPTNLHGLSIGLTVNLASPQVFEAFDVPASNVSNERSNNESDKIYDILKRVCDTHRLPLAQTWTLSPFTCYFAHENGIEKGCCSFDTRCVGKVCMSTALPRYVLDMNTWTFFEASKTCHLEKSRGVAGRALSSRGSCFCGDVTKLDVEEYPLVHHAHISRLTGCFAIFLHSIEGKNDFVLEFFLPSDINDSRHVPDLVQTLKQSIEAASGFELGDGSAMEIVGSPTDSSLNEMVSSDLESVVADADVADQWSSTKEDRKRKRDSDTEQSTSGDSDTEQSTSTVMVNVTFNKSKTQFAFPLFRGLSKLKRKVAKRFKLESQKLKLEYIDEENDKILICRNDDLKPALDASGSNCSMNLICSEIIY